MPGPPPRPAGPVSPARRWPVRRVALYLTGLVGLIGRSGMRSRPLGTGVSALAVLAALLLGACGGSTRSGQAGSTPAGQAAPPVTPPAPRALTARSPAFTPAPASPPPLSRPPP